ncbi:MAG: hypothetical protein ACR2J1_08100 [Methyloceanibacter sp.]|uniref:hypothetical protein n=1 Tax=Methyloceanibacter sp. TaxID=1965321 RepID=UPI003D9B4E65
MKAARFVVGIAIAAGLLAGLVPSPSSAETGKIVQPGKVVQPGKLVVAGRRLSCGSTATLIRDFEGFAVSSNVIMLNMQALKELPRRVQWLIYYHECGHILLGPNEIAADCYAVRRARREGWLNQAGIEEICTAFNISGHGPVHPDPEERCDRLRQCFMEKGVTADGSR